MLPKSIFVAFVTSILIPIVLSACTPFQPVTGGGDGLAPIIGPGGKQIYYINHDAAAVLKCLDPARKTVYPGSCYGYNSGEGPAEDGYALPPCLTGSNTCNTGCTSPFPSASCVNIQTPIWTTPHHTGWDRWKFVGNRLITAYWDSSKNGGLTCMQINANWPPNTYNPPVPCNGGSFTNGYVQTTMASPTVYPILDYYELFNDGVIFYIDSKFSVGCLDVNSLSPCTLTGTNPVTSTNTMTKKLFQLDYVTESASVSRLYIMFSGASGIYLDCVRITKGAGYAMSSCPATQQLIPGSPSSDIGEMFIVKDSSGNGIMACANSEDGPSTTQCAKLDGTPIIPASSEAVKIATFNTWLGAGKTLSNQYSFGTRMYFGSRSIGSGIYCYDWALDDSCQVVISGVAKCFGDISTNYVAGSRNCGHRLPPASTPNTKDYAVVRDQYGCIYSYGDSNILWAVDENGSENAAGDPYCKYGSGLNNVEYCFGTNAPLSPGCSATVPTSYAGPSKPPAGSTISLDIFSYSVEPPFGWNWSELVVTSPSLGTATINTANPTHYTIDYTFANPATNPYSTSFTYSICDNSFFPEIFTATVNIQAVFNNPPVANDDSFGMQQGTAMNIPVLANDSDPDAGDVISISNPAVAGSVSPPSLAGSLTTNGNQINFNPSSSFCGSISFTYEISDTDGLKDTATVSGYVNCRPIANPDSQKYDHSVSQSTSIQVTNNDSDSDGGIDPNSVTITVQPVCPGCACSATPAGAGQVTFTSTCGGSFVFTYQVCDFGYSSPSISPACVTATATVTALYWNLALPVDPATGKVYWSMYLPQEICWEHNIGDHDVSLDLIDQNFNPLVTLTSPPIASARNCFYYKPHNLWPFKPYYVKGTTLNVSQNPTLSGKSWANSPYIDLHPRPPPVPIAP